ncbi:MAG: hypothetical protein QOK10_3422 [Pseudonocardiales bacterium]|nr:hypothetical protein [Pseudonocardiales bacterium]
MTTPTKTKAPETPPPSRLSLSFTQIIGSVLAAVSATVIASYFGVAGTVIGAALGSLVSVVGGAVYTHSIDRTKHKLRAAAVDSAVAHRFGLNDTAMFAAAAGKDASISAHGPAGEQPEARDSRPDGADRAAQADEAGASHTAAARRRSGSQPWWSGLTSGLNLKRLALSSAALFALLIGGVTAFELVSGQPLSSTVTNKQGSGTTLGGGQTARQAPPSAALVPASAATPTGTSAATGAPAVGSAPTGSGTATGASTPSSTVNPGTQSSANGNGSSSDAPTPSAAPATGAAGGGASSAAGGSTTTPTDSANAVSATPAPSSGASTIPTG